MEQGMRHLVAVYPDERSARAAAEHVEQAGVSPDAIRIGRPEDHSASLVAEMRAETDEAWLGPQAGLLLTKEMARGVAMVVPVLAALGAFISLLLTPFVLDALPLWARLIVLGGLGAVAGGAAGFIIGGGEAGKGAQEPLAAERGVALRIASDDRRLEEILVASNPIRIDRVAGDGAGTGTVAGGDRQRGDGAADDLRTAWREPGRP